MKVAMIQPSFMPWQGLFEFISKSDRFIVLDDFQFSVQSWHQRNRLFLNKGTVGWYTLPVKKKGSFSSSINETFINDASNWRKKMWKRIQQNYSKASFFGEYSPVFEDWMFSSSRTVGELNISFIKLVCKVCHLKTDFLYSSQQPSKLKRSERVMEILRWSGAKTYLVSNGSFDYMRKDGIFPGNNVEILFQNFIPKPYFQIGSPGEFHPYLSVLDALFNIGAEETLSHINNGTESWISWDEMILAKKTEGSEGHKE